MRHPVLYVLLNHENYVEIWQILFFFKIIYSAHDSQQFLECEKNGGFYSKTACVFVVQSPSLISWDGLFLTCDHRGALPAHLYDTEDLMEHVWAYLLRNVRCILFKFEPDYNLSVQ